MYLGIDVHKRYAQVAVMDEAGEIVEEVRVGVISAAAPAV
jgi:predicted NBD/HSP70 family sugar kinase